MTELFRTGQGLSIRNNENPKELPVCVDFTDKTLTHRRRYLLHTKDGLVKAIHKKNVQLNILDATAGLGQDSFLLASLGHKVTMLERSPVVQALLEDGLARGALIPELKDYIQNMKLIKQDSQTFLSQSIDTYDVIYCDPMFPISSKSRLVGKGMRVLSTVVGTDPDAVHLVELALKTKSKVVVKRPKLGPPLIDPPCYAYHFKSCRFDVYTPNRSLYKK